MRKVVRGLADAQSTHAAIIHHARLATTRDDAVRPRIVVSRVNRRDDRASANEPTVRRARATGLVHTRGAVSEVAAFGGFRERARALVRAKPGPLASSRGHTNAKRRGKARDGREEGNIGSMLQSMRYDRNAAARHANYGNACGHFGVLDDFLQVRVRLNFRIFVRVQYDALADAREQGKG